jgi:hypothetical protein
LQVYSGLEYKSNEGRAVAHFFETMKNFLKYILLNMIAVLSIFTAYLGVQSLRLNWWGAPERVTLEPLSPEQKAEDMRYLLDLIRRVSQADAVWQAAGLDNPLDQPEAWVRRAQ